MTNAECRTRARFNLGESIFSTNWMTALAICLTAGVMTPNVSSLSRVLSREVYYLIVGSFFIIRLLIGGPIQFGLNLAFLKKARGASQYEFEDLFKGFPMFADCFILALMRGLLILVWFLIPIAGIYFGIKKEHSYAMAFYVKVDHPGIPWRECLDRSEQLMEGYRWQLFCLHFSFIGWYLLGILACGIGTLWVVPYENAAVAEFYEQRRIACGDM